MIEWLFPMPVYCHKPTFDEIFLVQNEIKKNLPNIIENDNWDKPEGWEDEVETNIGHRWHSIADYGLTNLEQYIQKHTDIYRNELEPFMNNDIFLSHSWFNLNKAGHSQEWHAHTDSFISGVYYYQTNGQDGDLMFKNTNQFAQRGFFPTGKKVPEKVFYSPVEGMILLFPGWMDHRVQVNKTEDTRITVAFNWLTVNTLRKGLIKDERTNK